VLVAEDNPVNQLVVLEQLASLGFEATAVSNGLEALAALEEKPYDLVLMDCQMPELDGYETTLRMRRREGERWRVPVIALTAHAMQGDREKCLVAGMNDYISKPFRVETLRQIIQRWLAPGATASADTPAPEAPPAAAAVDPEALERIRALGRAAGRDLLRQLVETFSSRPHLEELREAMAAGDRKSLELRAHSLKGSAGTLGAQRLADLCAELEHGARSASPEPFVPQIDALEEEYRRVLAELQAAAGAVPP
jgi:CheY-like chemotaxis protein/HPt (histidine-containing phosphotransfer) domain-containing protein